MNRLLPYLQDWFLQKEEHFVAFANADSRLEGWFKAEMLVLLNRVDSVFCSEGESRGAGYQCTRYGS